MAPKPPRADDDDSESADTHTLLRVHSASSFKPTRPALNGSSAAEADEDEDEDAPAPMVLMRRPTLMLGAASATTTMTNSRDGNEATKAVRKRVDTSRMQRANEVIIGEGCSDYVFSAVPECLPTEIFTRFEICSMPIRMPCLHMNICLITMHDFSCVFFILLKLFLLAC
jgi:hypothetical protein